MGSFQEYIEGQSVEIVSHSNCAHTIGVIEVIDQLTKQPTHIRCKNCERLGMTIYQKPLTQK